MSKTMKRLHLLLLWGIVLLFAACSSSPHPMTPAVAYPTATSSSVSSQANLARQNPTPYQAFPSPTPTPIPTTPPPTPTPVKDRSQRALENISQRLDRAIDEKDATEISTLFEALDTLKSTFPEQTASLRSRARFALDAATGCYYLNSFDYRRIAFTTPEGDSLRYPIIFIIAHDKLFFIDSGNLYMGDLANLDSAASTLVMEKILDREMWIDGYPVKEIVNLAMTDEGTLYVVDKSNDVYVSQDLGQNWHFEYVSARDHHPPAPLFKSIASFQNRVYLLDPARNQVWRHPLNGMPEGYLPGILPWKLEPGDVDVSDGVDLTIDGRIFVLNRRGTILRLNPAQDAVIDFRSADTLCHAPGWNRLPLRPVSISAAVDEGPLIVADAGKRRILFLDRETGDVQWQIVAPDHLDFASLRGAVQYDGRIVAIAGNYLYLIPYPNAQKPWEGTLPQVHTWQTEDMEGLSPASLPPQDPRIPFILEHSHHFIIPIRGARLPDRDAIYPGARRAYRYGVHQGMDFFSQDVGAPVRVGTPVHVVADGIVIRADIHYQEMTYEQAMALLDEANALHVTPPETLNKLGGRQVWVQHGDGVITKYLHLNAIKPGIEVGKEVKQGDIIGAVGLSGTPDGILGRTQYAHLHFEIRLGPNHEYYFGQWMTSEQTRHAFCDLFPTIPVKPAFEK
jgi:murein DD-endopeptidase MepM/ murein hydrolase activator NlpD